MGFHYYLVNEEYQDPVVFFQFDGMRESFIFDCGYLFPIRLRDLQRITQIFVSHTHFDHFMGFDQFLRVNMEQDKIVEMYGPPHFIEQVYHKLKGYTWNLCDSVNLDFLVRETDGTVIREALLKGKDAYNLQDIREAPLSGDCIRETEVYRIRVAVLDHRIPSLAYSLEEKNVFRVKKDELDRLGLKPGPWIKDLKDKAVLHADSDDELSIDGMTFKRKALESMVLEERIGRKISYIVDTIYDENTAAKGKALIEGSDVLFCEMAYLAAEKDRALVNYHLTAHQAAQLARDGRVRVLHPIHFSKRYDKRYQELVEEGRSVFPAVERAPKYNG